jgi:ribonuclease D
MINPHDGSNCPVLHFARFDLRDFNLIGTRIFVAFCDTQSFSLTIGA